MYRQFFVLSLVFSTVIGDLISQTGFENWVKPLENYKIQPVVGIQLWSVYSTGEELYDANSNVYNHTPDRMNTMIRRSRFGFKAQPYTRLKFTLVTALDLVGRDSRSGIVGGVNNGSRPTLGLWNAFVQWRISKHNESLHIIVGYFPPQLGKESFTSAFSVNSMAKSFSQAYIRQHLTGKNPGRTTGILFGGLWIQENRFLNFQYSFGVHNPIFTKDESNSSGNFSSPLLVGRTVFYFGDPETSEFKLNGDINAYGKRKGLSLGISVSRQGKSSIFVDATAFGFDFLFNHGKLNVDGEYYFLWRKGTREADNLVRNFNYLSKTGFARIGYNVTISQRWLIEPVFMAMGFRGAFSKIEHEDAVAVRAFSGEEQTYDLGINWYLNQRKLKLLLHYTWRSGNPGAIPEHLVRNQYYVQKEVGAIKRGNWLGLGCNMVL